MKEFSVTTALTHYTKHWVEAENFEEACQQVLARWEAVRTGAIQRSPSSDSIDKHLSMPAGHSDNLGIIDIREIS